jgi:rod shape-determining protein MreB
MDEFIGRETGVAVHIAEDPVSCVAAGTKTALERLNIYGGKGRVSRRD